MTKKYKISEIANKIGKTTRTLRRWDESGVLPAKRSASNQRYYDESDLRKALRIELPDVEKKILVYCRVSSKNQSDDLASQVKAMQIFCLAAGLAVDEWVQETGSGMNFKRKKFLEIMQSIEQGEIENLIIAHKDRLVRFGFDYFSDFAERHGCKIIVANQDQLSPQAEIVEDLMSIVNTFSCRLYGLGNYKKQIKEAAKE
ncbi:IS607-like element ISSto11 family transposase [soil metagenome]